MTAKVILNPYANRWKAKARWPEAESALKAAGVDFEMVISERPGHIIELADQAVRQGFSPIIAAGGDGTIGEAVNGLALASKSETDLLGPLGILPLGTANDLVYNLRLPLDLHSAAQIIKKGNSKRMDIGRVNDLYFANNSAAGLEPYVTTKQIRIKWISGILRYLVAAVWAIMDRPKWVANINWDDGEYNGPISLVTIGNGARSGGVFYMIPHADPFDGKLTFVYGYRSTRRAMLATLPRAMKPDAGSYVEMEGIFEQKASWIKIHLENPSPAHSDGELFSNAIRDLDYHIYPGRLLILLP
ncbi:MAG: YegS/Rv2252/BmrU family lipid kinase [Anaerolineales bacterium]|jgi:diacylglycerol kinase (ATP)